jgi:8-oxo-dGTP diphosphatase
VRIGETVMSACRREVKEETGIEVIEISLVGVYSDIERDPRGHVVSVAFMTELTTKHRHKQDRTRGAPNGGGRYVRH